MAIGPDKSSQARRFRRLKSRRIHGFEVKVASDPVSRLLGLALLDRHRAPEGLLIPRCRSVHTFGMRFPQPFVGMRVGGVAIVTPLLDWGASASYEHNHPEDLDEIQLHPVQVREVMAYLASVHARFNRPPSTWSEQETEGLISFTSCLWLV